jgi:thioredoxin reductase
VTRPTHDVLIVGGGPAGASAALVLGRARRRVLVVDDGRPRNARSRALHAFPTRDGTPPEVFRELAGDELAAYGVERWAGEVVDVRGAAGDFRVVLADGREASGRKLLLATGVHDVVPPLLGLDAYYGTSVHLCPYCDGWEHRDEPIAVYGRGRRALQMARALTAWSRDLLVCTDGPSGLGRRALDELAAHRIPLVDARIVDLEGNDGRLAALRFEDGRRIERTALFFDTPSFTRTRLAERLGCEVGRDGEIRCHRHASTSVRGVYAAGDVTRDVQLVVLAAAEGAKAAFGINVALTREDWARRVEAQRPHGT